MGSSADIWLWLLTCAVCAFGGACIGKALRLVFSNRPVVPPAKVVRECPSLASAGEGLSYGQKKEGDQ